MIVLQLPESNTFTKFLMCSRADPKKYADLNQLAQQFLEGLFGYFQSIWIGED
jgi:hypothetical protein